MYKIGDVVRLKSGGPKMTVSLSAGGAWRCLWFDIEMKLQVRDFPDEVLQIATADLK